MSAKATFWAWEQDLATGAKLVLLCLADCHNADTGRCDPSAKYIAEKTGMDVKTVYKHLKGLDEGGLISKDSRSGTSNSYVIRVTQKRVNPKTGQPKNGIGGDPKTGQGGDPKTGHEPISKPKKNLQGDFAEFWKVYPRPICKHKAELAFEKSDYDLEAIKQDIEHRLKSEEWELDRIRFIPHPATYLNGRYWKDKPATKKEKKRWT